MPARTYEIEPEPEPAVAAAIVEALERLAAEDGWDAPPDASASPWRAQAAREAVASELP